ncbi:unnamed protein product, partial [Tilletia caries]
MLASTTVEISIDSTYGTNNAGHELFGILAELDGTGVPLAYCFLNTKDMEADGRKISILTEVLQALKGRGLTPTFVGCDKDSAELAAIANVWPTAKVQLCYWHVRRAVRQKLASTKPTSTRKYNPWDAIRTIPDLEPCWGVVKNLRHHSERCKCECKKDASQWDEPGRLECNKADSVIILDLLSKHLNEHTAFPTLHGIYLTQEQLYRRQAKEAYDLCKAKGWARVWAYLWANWYTGKEWKLWARGANESIPILKSTMVTESHWRVIKHDYLHRFARPRIDLVTFILQTRVLPTAVKRVVALRAGNDRIARPAWRTSMAVAWKKEAAKEVSAEAIQRYRTDVHAWKCACPALPMHRFLLCKHLVSLAPPMTVPALRTMKRHRQSPFWTHPDIVRPAGASDGTKDDPHNNQASNADAATAGADDGSGIDEGARSDDDSEADARSIRGEWDEGEERDEGGE